MAPIIHKLPNGMGIAITEEMIEDKVLDNMANRYTKALAKAMGTTKEVLAAQIMRTVWDQDFPDDYTQEVDFGEPK